MAVIDVNGSYTQPAGQVNSYNIDDVPGAGTGISLPNSATPSTVTILGSLSFQTDASYLNSSSGTFGLKSN